MPCPFPGMDPYLEDPAVFPDLHDSLIIYIRETVNALLPAPYFASSAARTWIETRHIVPDVNVLQTGSHANGGQPRPATSAGGVAVLEANAAEPIVIHVPQDEVRETYLEIYHRAGGERLVASLEILSPANKTTGEHGRGLYLQKQKEILARQVHLVEIDLLRGGKHTTAVPRAMIEAKVGPFDYHVCIHHFDKPEDYFVYARPMEMRLPPIALPLLPGDGSVTLDLQDLLDKCYDTGNYSRRIRYKQKTPVPPLSTAQSEWAQQMLRSKGLWE